MGAKPLEDLFEDLWPEQKPEAEAERRAAAPTRTQEEVDNAYRAGVAEGRRRAEEARAADAKSLLEELRARLDARARDADAAIAAHLNQLTAQATAFCRRFACGSYDANAHARLQEAIVSILKASAPKPLRLAIAAAPQDIDAFTDAIGDLAGDLDLRVDASRAPGDFEIAWEDGGLVEARAEYAAEIDRAIDDFFSVAEAMTAFAKPDALKASDGGDDERS